MKVHWTENAQGHLDSIYSFIAQNSLHYAIKTVDDLTRRSIQIGAFPLSGTIVPEYELKQIRQVFEGSYRIIYYIKPDQIDVLGVIHTARVIEHSMKKSRTQKSSRRRKRRS